jgi:transposase-like protein
VDRNEIVSVRAFTSRNSLATKLFIEEVLEYCDGEPTFVVDRAPWLREALEEPKLQYNQEPFRHRSLVESVYSSFKQRTKAFSNNITSNPKNISEKPGRPIFCWNPTIKLSMLYYNHLRKRT